MLKSSSHCCSETLKKLFNDTINDREFPDKLKLADVTVTFKKDDPNKLKKLWT